MTQKKDLSDLAACARDLVCPNGCGKLAQLNKTQARCPKCGWHVSGVNVGNNAHADVVTLEMDGPEWTGHARSCFLATEKLLGLLKKHLGFQALDPANDLGEMVAFTVATYSANRKDLDNEEILRITTLVYDTWFEVVEKAHARKGPLNVQPGPETPQ